MQWVESVFIPNLSDAYGHTRAPEWVLSYFLISILIIEGENCGTGYLECSKPGRNFEKRILKGTCGYYKSSSKGSSCSGANDEISFSVVKTIYSRKCCLRWEKRASTTAKELKEISVIEPASAYVYLYIFPPSIFSGDEEEICTAPLLRYLRHQEREKKGSDQTDSLSVLFSGCKKRRRVYWWACIIASEMNAAETCFPPNQRPLRPWIAFLAESIESNLT